jgi:hypothetical protein
MQTVEELLRDADPLRDEPPRSEADWEQLRRAVLSAASGSPGTRRIVWSQVAPVVVAVVVGLAVVFATLWSGGGTNLQAAVRFEARLAETHPGPGLREVRISPEKTIYLHDEVVVTNDDIVASRVIPGNASSQFHVAVTFNETGAEKIRRATAGHIGQPLALLIDAQVISAPTIRSAISTEALITGDFTQAEAERIANGMMVR